MTYTQHEAGVSRRTALKWSGLAVGLPMAGGLLTACGPGSSANSDTSGAAKASGVRGVKGSKTTLKMASSMPTHADNAHTVWFDKFVSGLHSGTGGRVGAIFYGDSQLGPETGYLNQIQSGTIDLTMGPDLYSAKVPQVSVLTMGFLFDSMDQMGKALDGTAGKLIAKLLSQHVNVEILGWAYNFGGRNVLSKKAIRTPRDFHGVKLRVQPAPTFVQTFKLLGADPVAMDFGQVYTSLQTGVIDGLEHDAPTILQNKLYELAKSMTLTEHIFDPLSPTISKSSLARLPGADQHALRTAAAAAVTYQRSKAKAAAGAAMSQLKSKGMTTISIDRDTLRGEVKPLWSSFTAKYPETKPVLSAIQSATGS